jgi:hypothetical protein
MIGMLASAKCPGDAGGACGETLRVSAKIEKIGLP